MVNALDGSLLNQQKLDCIPGQLVLSPDGSYAFFTCKTTIIQMDIQGWNIYRRYSGHGEVFTHLSMSPNGDFGLTASADGSIRIWNLGDQLDFQIISIDADILNALAISSDGNYLILNDYYHDGFEEPAMWDINQQKVVKVYYQDRFLFINAGEVKISPDNRYISALAIQKSDGISVMGLWDVETQSLLCYTGFEGTARALVFSPDNLHLLVGTQVTGKAIGQLFLCDIQTCKIMLQFDTNEDVSSIAFNKDGSRAVSGSGLLGRIILWDVTSGKESKRFSYPDNSPAFAVAFGPGDSTILGSALGEIYLWDVKTSDLLNRFTGLSTFPKSLTVSHDGRFLLSATMNGDLILWDYSTGEELHRINTHLAISEVLFSPDGKKAYAAALEGKLIELSINEKSLPELLDWIKVNRYLRVLTCAERQQFHVDPQCKP